MHSRPSSDAIFEEITFVFVTEDNKNLPGLLTKEPQSHLPLLAGFSKHKKEQTDKSHAIKRRSFGPSQNDIFI